MYGDGLPEIVAALPLTAGSTARAAHATARGATAASSSAPFSIGSSAVCHRTEVHLVLDNLKTHKAGLIHDWLLKRPRFHLHFTPASASWLNLVECWFALLSRRCLERDAFTSVGDLEATIHAYIAETNAEPKPLVWTKIADGILGSIAHFCQRTFSSGH